MSLMSCQERTEGPHQLGFFGEHPVKFNFYISHELKLPFCKIYTCHRVLIVGEYDFVV